MKHTKWTTILIAGGLAFGFYVVPRIIHGNRVTWRGFPGGWEWTDA